MSEKLDMTEFEPEPLFEGLAIWHAFLLRKAAQRVTDLAEAVLGPLHLTMRHFGVLSMVEAEPGLNQRSVGARLRIDRTSIVALVDDLERDGFVERHRGADRRAFSLWLTPAGAERLDQSRKIMAEAHEHFLRRLSPAEREDLRTLLFRVTVDESRDDH
jgi:DNA-binding MarR family transcriptional regulator